jgi:hypothetical protein
MVAYKYIAEHSDLFAQSLLLQTLFPQALYFRVDAPLDSGPRFGCGQVLERVVG